MRSSYDPITFNHARPYTFIEIIADILQAMHAGVIRDMERQAKIQAERQLDFDVQQALEKEYLKVQDVKDTSQG